MDKTSWIESVAGTFGRAAGAFQKARSQILGKKSPEFLQGLSIDSGNWTGGSLGNTDFAQMRAARNSWFYVGVNTKALDIAASTFNVYSNPSGIEDDGIKAEGHPFLSLIRRPNPYMGKALFLQYIEWWMELQGEAFVFIEGTKNNVRGLWPVPSNKVDIEFSEDGKSIKRYVLKLHKWYYVDPAFMVHVKFPNPWDFFRGLPPLISYMLAIDADTAMKIWNGSFFGKDNVMPSAVISLGTGDANNMFEQKDLDSVKEELQNEYSAIRRKTAITNANSMSVALLGWNSKDMDFMAGMAWNKDEILNALGIPPGMLDKNATEANAKVSDKRFKDNMWGLKSIIADQFTLDLLQPFYGEDLEMRFEDDRVYDRELELREAQMAQQVMSEGDWSKKYFNYELPAGETPMAVKRQEQAVERAGKIQGLKDGGTQSKPTPPDKNVNPNMSTKNRYAPWEEYGMTELEYYKSLYLSEVMKGGAGSGDEEGHPFRGNQYSTGFGGGDVYHGTTMENAKRIVEEGFLAGGKNRISNYGRKPAVYFTENEATLESNMGNIVHFQFSVPNPGRVRFDKVDYDMYGAEENWYLEEDVSPENIHAVFVNGKRYSIDEFKRKFAKKSIDIEEELQALKSKAHNLFKKKNTLKSLAFTSEILEPIALQSIISDLQGVEVKSDIDFIFDHWRDELMKGGTGSGDNDGHPFRGNQWTEEKNKNPIVSGQQQVSPNSEIASIEMFARSALTREEKIQAFHDREIVIEARKKKYDDGTIIANKIDELISNGGSKTTIIGPRAYLEGNGNKWTLNTKLERDYADYVLNRKDKYSDSSRYKSITMKGGSGSGEQDGHPFRGNQWTGELRNVYGAFELRSGFPDKLHREKVKQAIQIIDRGGKPLKVFGTDRTTEYGFASIHGDVYLSSISTKDKSAGFIASVIYHETVHIDYPDLSENEVREKTSEWIADNQVEMPNEELEILNRRVHGEKSVELNEFHKALSWRPWTMFESILKTAVIQALQNILNLLLERANENMGDDINLWNEVTALFKQKAVPVYQNIATKAVKDTSLILSKSNIQISYELTNSRAIEWSLQYAGDQIKGIGETDKKAVKKVIQEWIDSGRDNGIQGLRDRLQTITDENGVSLFGEKRAERIARSEATSIYAGATEAALVQNGFPPALFKPRAHVNCRCYIQPGFLGDKKVIVWYTARDEMVCKIPLETPFGMITGCRELHRMVISEGMAGTRYDKNLWNPETLQEE